MQPHGMTPERLTRLRIRNRVEYEFAVERNCIEDGAAVSEPELRAELDRLSQTEQRVLRSRLRKQIRRVDELMQTSRKTFDEPYATPDDLPATVTLTNEAIE